MTNNLIISISGAKHSGKQDFMKAIKEKYPDKVVLIHDLLRSYKNEFDVNNSIKYLQIEQDLINKQIEIEKSLNNKYKNKIIILNKSLFDRYFYYILYINKNILLDNLYKQYHQFLDKLYKILVFHMREIYDYSLIAFPIKSFQESNIIDIQTLIQEHEFFFIKTFHQGILYDLNKLLYFNLKTQQEDAIKTIKYLYNKKFKQDK